MKPVAASGSEAGSAGVPSLMEAAQALGNLGAEESGARTETAGAETGAEAGAEEAGAEAGEETGAEAEATDETGEQGAEEERAARLTPAQQKIFDARLGKEVGKRKAAEEKAAKLEADLASAKAATEETTVDVARTLQVLPEYLKPGEAAVLKQDAELVKFEDWAAEHWDGYESTDGGKSYTAAQVRKRHAEVTREHARIARQADEIRERARKDMQDDIREGRKAKLARQQAETALKNRQPAKPGTPVEPKPAGSARTGERPSPDAIFEKRGKNRQAAAEALGSM
jgi:hypothetical protein